MAEYRYTITVTIVAKRPLSMAETQHLAFNAADEVVKTIIDDARVELVEPVSFNYGPGAVQ